MHSPSSQATFLLLSWAFLKSEAFFDPFLFSFPLPYPPLPPRTTDLSPEVLLISLAEGGPALGWRWMGKEEEEEEEDESRSLIPLLPSWLQKITLPFALFPFSRLPALIPFSCPPPPPPRAEMQSRPSLYNQLRPTTLVRTYAALRPFYPSLKRPLSFPQEKERKNVKDQCKTEDCLGMS